MKQLQKQPTGRGRRKVVCVKKHLSLGQSKAILLGALNARPSSQPAAPDCSAMLAGAGRVLSARGEVEAEGVSGVGGLAGREGNSGC